MLKTKEEVDRLVEAFDEADRRGPIDTSNAVHLVSDPEEIRKILSAIAVDADDEHMLHNVSSNIPFDCRTNYDADISDIRPSLIYEYLSKIGCNCSVPLLC